MKRVGPTTNLCLFESEGVSCFHLRSAEEFQYEGKHVQSTVYGLVSKCVELTSTVLFSHLHTPPKINIEPENDCLEDDFALPGVYTQVPF